MMEKKRTREKWSHHKMLQKNHRYSYMRAPIQWEEFLSVFIMMRHTLKFWINWKTKPRRVHRVKVHTYLLTGHHWELRNSNLISCKILRLGRHIHAVLGFIHIDFSLESMCYSDIKRKGTIHLELYFSDSLIQNYFCVDEGNTHIHIYANYICVCLHTHMYNSHACAWIFTYMYSHAHIHVYAQYLSIWFLLQLAQDRSLCINSP